MISQKIKTLGVILLGTAGLCLASASPAAVEESTSEGWVKDWFKGEVSIGGSHDKGVLYDYYTTKDFIEFSEGTGVFAPLCSELNVLLQISEGEYGSKLMNKGTKYANKALDKFKKMNPDIVNVAGRAYLPKKYKRSRTFLRRKKSYNVDVYSANSDFKDMIKKHSEWIEEKTKGLVEADLKESNLKDGKRLYYTTSYFKDDWHIPFLMKNTIEYKFTLPSGETQERAFMQISDKQFKYESVEKERFEFKMVALPYKEKNKKKEFNRYMVYLVPSDKKQPDLKMLWEKFLAHAKYDIKKYLARAKRRTIDVCVPKIDELRSKLDLTEVLKTTYGDGPSLITSSTMSLYLKINEKGTTAAAVTSTDCVDGPGGLMVIADRPYISFIFDVPTGRVLFVLKDEGISKKKE